MIQSSILLSCMVLSYLLPIGCVGYHYQSEKNNSISSVLNMPECQMTILLGMISMGTFTLWYEWVRGGGISSFLTILSVLVGIYGVILIEENTVVHYVFGGLIFFGMILFMVIHYSKSPTVFGSILAIHSILSVVLMIQCFCHTDIFLCEVALVLSFAVYYLYLHYVEMTESKPSVKEEKTEGEKTEGEKTEGEKTEGEKTEGEKTEGEKTEGEKTEGEKTD